MKAWNRRMLTSVSAALATTGALLVPADSASAGAPTDGCPVGYQRLYVPDLTARGYRLPALVDSPTSGVLSFGQPGNGNNYVCGVQLGNQLTPFGEPIYNFIDDQLPVS